jgi:hypothetical protein
MRALKVRIRGSSAHYRRLTRDSELKIYTDRIVEEEEDIDVASGISSYHVSTSVDWIANAGF